MERKAGESVDMGYCHGMGGNQVSRRWISVSWKGFFVISIVRILGPEN